MGLQGLDWDGTGRDGFFFLFNSLRWVWSFLLSQIFATHFFLFRYTFFTFSLFPSRVLISLLEFSVYQQKKGRTYRPYLKFFFFAWYPTVNGR